MLRLLGTDLDGPDIARELTVSLNTVRTHTKHIYAKLAVTNRRAAVRRASGTRPVVANPQPATLTRSSTDSRPGAGTSADHPASAQPHRRLRTAARPRSIALVLS